MVQNVKGRSTGCYQLATASNQTIELWSLDPFAGRLEARGVRMGASVRDFSCLAFGNDNSVLYAGSKSGDVSVVRVRHGVLECCFPVCRIGVRAIAVGISPRGDGEVVMTG